MASKLISKYLDAKDPVDYYDVSFTFVTFMADYPGDSIATYTVNSNSEDLIADQIQLQDNVLTAWFRGGIEGTTYIVSAEITTAQGRHIKRSYYLPVDATS